MNKEWADKNKKMQALIGKEATFTEGQILSKEICKACVFPS